MLPSALPVIMPVGFPDIPFYADGRYPKALIGKSFRAYLLELRNSSTPFKGIRKTLVDTLLDGYDSARYGTGVSAGPGWISVEPAAALAALLTPALCSTPALGRTQPVDRISEELFCLCPGLWED